MKIRGFDPLLPPSESGKGKIKSASTEKPVRSDSIEISAKAKANSANRLEKNHPDSSGAARNISDRIEINSGNDRDRVLDIVRQRVDDGYYNSPRHLEKLADILIEKLGLRRPEEN